MALRRFGSQLRFRSSSLAQILSRDHIGTELPDHITETSLSPKALSLNTCAWRALLPMSGRTDVCKSSPHRGITINREVLERDVDNVHSSESSGAGLSSSCSSSELQKNDVLKDDIKYGLPDSHGLVQKASKRHNLAMMFTCKVCQTRSAKTMSRETYERGVVIVRCGGCQNLHLIADHLGWFGEPGSVEDFLAKQGVEVRKGSEESYEFSLEDLAGWTPPEKK